MVMSRKYTKAFAAVIILFTVLCIVTSLLAGKSGAGLSQTLAISDFYFCTNLDQNENSYSRTDTISLAAFTKELFICGNAITDGRPAMLSVLIYQNSTNNFVLDAVPAGETVSSGFFAYAIPKDAFNETGVYKASFLFGRVSITSTLITVTP